METIQGDIRLTSNVFNGNRFVHLRRYVNYGSGSKFYPTKEGNYSFLLVRTISYRKQPYEIYSVSELRVRTLLARYRRHYYIPSGIELKCALNPQSQLRVILLYLITIFDA